MTKTRTSMSLPSSTTFPIPGLGRNAELKGGYSSCYPTQMRTKSNGNFGLIARPFKLDSHFLGRPKPIHTAIQKQLKIKQLSRSPSQTLKAAESSLYGQ